MSDWTGNNVAHRQTWYVLRVMDQNRLGFKESKEVRMDQLTYWAATGSADMRAQRAKAMATEMDNIFRMILKAGLEPGVDAGRAIGGIETTLATADKTIRDLAVINDEHYVFLGEDE